jgi:holo-[acyl-carrier protein] synthase
LIINSGISLISVDWIRNCLEHQSETFKTFFHPDEIAYCDKYRFSAPHYAGRYASKKAVRKALGLPSEVENTLQEIFISRTSTGQPVVQLLGQTLLYAQTLSKELILSLSISHSRLHAIAIVVTEKKTFIT